MALTDGHKPRKEREPATGENGGSRRSDPREQAIKYKAFRHTFSEQEIQRGINERKLDKKLKRSNSLVDRYHQYLEMREHRGGLSMAFPWRNPFNRVLFSTFYWMPKVVRWGLLVLAILLFVNYLPGPTQHIVEVAAARAVYDAAPIARLPDSLESYAPSARIVDRGGNVIKSYGRRQVTQEVPVAAKMAVLACEDQYFLPHPAYPWYVNAFLIHPGVSWFNLAGAVRDTLMGRPRGGSTVVMQNAKKIIGNTERTVTNKLEEIILSYMMVARFGKDENLDFYVNTVPVGANIYGFPAAAESYFRRDLSELNYQQLVAIGAFIPNHFRQVAFYRVVQGASFAELDPTLAAHTRAAINKVNSALNHLHRLGEISDRQLQEWRLSDEESIRNIGFRDFRSPLYGEEEWTSWNVIREVTSRSYRINGRTVSGSQLLLDVPGDVVIETAIDLDLTEESKKIIAEFLASPEYRQVLRRRNRDLWQRELARYDNLPREAPFHDFESFMALLERHVNVGVMAVNQRGEVVAYVGGKEFPGAGGGSANLITRAEERAEVEDEQSGQTVIIDLMNRRATLAPSSTIKPVVGYYAMVAADVKPEHTFADQPLEFKYVEEEGRQIWLPRNWYNYDQRGQGRNRYQGRQYSLTEAQVLSVNTIFARLYSNRLVQNAMLGGLDRIGLEYSREDARYWPFGIGASDLRVQQWLAVYNAFLDGNYREPAFVRRITVNERVIYQRDDDSAHRPRPLFDQRREREAAMKILYEIVNRGTGSAMKPDFPYYYNLVSGKTGTAPQARSSLFVGHFNPQRDRRRFAEDTITMMVLFTTNTGGFKSVGLSSEGPVRVAGRIFDRIFQENLRRMMDGKIAEAQQENSHFRNNHVYWANVNRYMDTMLNGKCGDGRPIHEQVIGVDGFAEALDQILNPNNQIYTGRDNIFQELVRYYCDQGRMIRIN